MQLQAGLKGGSLWKRKLRNFRKALLEENSLNLFLKAFNGKTFGQGAYAFREGYVICMLPTLLSGSPITTVGLGDTLTAGTFLRGLELDVQA